MRNLQSIIKRYLSLPTSHAVLMKGGFGKGKTHHFKEIIEPLINATRTPANDNKKYKCVYVSLFGLKSTEDIATKIVFEFFESKIFKPFLGKANEGNGLKITKEIFKMGFNGFINFFRLGSAKDYTTSIRKIGNNVLDTSELVVCFDDLERKSSELAMSDLTGYINTLSDLQVKVVVIANEDFIIKNEEIYKDFKEKIIGVSIEYIPDVPKTLLQIIDKRYHGYSEFQNFYHKNIDLFEGYAHYAEAHFRNIIYALDELFFFFGIFQKEIISIKTHPLASRLEQELPSLAQFILMMATEFKADNITNAGYREYINIDTFEEFLYAESEADKKKDTPIKKLLSKYHIDTSKYKFYSSIYFHLTGSQEFSLDKFQAEFKDIFNLQDGFTPEHYQYFANLNYDNYARLSDNEYEQQTKAVIEFAAKGFFRMSEYYTIMHYAERFDNVLELDLDAVVTKLLVGLQYSALHNLLNTGEEKFRFKQSGRISGLNSHNKKLFDEGCKILKDEEDRQELNKLNGIIGSFLNSPKEFANRFRTDYEFNNLINHTPFLAKANLSELTMFFLNETTETLDFIDQFLRERYERSTSWTEEKVTLERVAENLDEHLKQSGEKAKTRQRFLQQQILDFIKSPNKY